MTCNNCTQTCLKRRNSYSPEEGRGAVTGGGGGGGGRRTKGGFEGDEGEGNSTLKSDTNINRFIYHIDATGSTVSKPLPHPSNFSMGYQNSDRVVDEW